MKMATVLVLLLSLVDHATGQSHHHGIFDLKSTVRDEKFDRFLQFEKRECHVCSRLKNLGPTFLPDAIPFNNEPEITCEIVNSDIFYEKVDYNASGSVPRCNIHRDKYEEVCCEFPETLPVYKCQENIQTDLLEDFNIAVVPQTRRRKMLPVKTLLRFWAVKELNVMTSTLDIFVDIDLSWNDPRLAWNVTSDACVSSMLVRASNNPEITQIWVPELDLLNREAGLRTMEDVSARVSSDGTVRWSRRGKIQAFCNFAGLGRMPFDTIDCKFSFGDPIPGNVEYYLADSDNGPQGVSFPNVAQKYTEFTVLKESTTTSVNKGIFEVRFYFERESNQHFFLVIFPTIVFVLLSFGQFFFPPHTGERVTFCITMLLIVVAQSIVTKEILPMCKENVWLNSFINSCQFFVIAGTCESLLVYCLITTKNGTIKRSFSMGRSATDFGDSNLVDANGDGRSRPSKGRGLSFIVWMDYFAMFALPLLYALYVIIMVTTVKWWDDGTVSD